MKIKVSEASPRQLDWLIAKCLGIKTDIPAFASTPWIRCTDDSGVQFVCPKWTLDWFHTGQLITLEKIGVLPDDGHRGSQWHAFCWAPSQHDLTFEDGQSCNQAGATPQIAICRCFVVCRLGEEVEAPAELI